MYSTPDHLSACLLRIQIGKRAARFHWKNATSHQALLPKTDEHPTVSNVYATFRPYLVLDISVHTDCRWHGSETMPLGAAGNDWAIWYDVTWQCKLATRAV